MKYKILSSLALAVLGITAIAPMASAGIAKDTYNGKVYSTGHAPREEVFVLYNDLPLIKKATAKDCGIVSLTVKPLLSSPSMEITFNGGTPAALSTFPLIEGNDLKPKCVNGVAENIPAGGKARWRKDLSSNISIIWTGQTPFTQHEVGFPIPKERKLKANACGIATISPSTAYPSSGTFSIVGNATVHDFSTLATTNAAPGCKNNTLLVPVGFPN